MEILNLKFNLFMYRLGKKQKRAILTEDGHEVVVFPKGKETLAEKVCNLLNADFYSKEKEQTIKDFLLWEQKYFDKLEAGTRQIRYRINRYLNNDRRWKQ